MRLTSMMNQFATLGDPEPDEKIITKYLHIARLRYHQLVVLIKTLIDISTLSVEEVTVRLKIVEEDNAAGNCDEGKFYLMEEQWLEKYKQKEQEGSWHNGGFSCLSKGRGGKSKSSTTSDSGGDRSGPPGTRSKDNCRSCGKIGHWARECCCRPKCEEQSHLVEDDEPILMLAHIEVLSSPNSIQSTVQAMEPWPLVTSVAPKWLIELVEEEVFAVLGDGGDGDPKRWIFDTDASNHMTDIKEVLSDLDTGVIGTIRFSDGSIVWIEGCSTVLFTCKNGEHRLLINVYYITRLTANIVNCGQLDEDGFQIHIERRVMRIHDEKKRLLVKIRRSVRRLYVLDITIARSVYLVACAGEDAWRWHAWFDHNNFDALQKMG
jgi:hypothetical protein